MIAKFKCWLFGHKRGKRLSWDEALHLPGGNDKTKAVIRCPRCKETWTRKVKV